MTSAKWSGTGRPPFGYDYDKSKRLLVINKTQSKHLLSLFNYALKNDVSAFDLITWLNNKGIKTTLGNQWSYKAVSYLFDPERLDIYSGYRNGIKGEWDPILDFQTAQKLKGKVVKTSGKRPRKNIYLLTGISYCGVCSHKIKSSTMTGPNSIIHYYMCSSKTLTGSASCTTGMYRQSILNDLVVTDLLVKFLSINKISKLNRQWELSKNKKIEQEIVKIKKRLDTLLAVQTASKNYSKVESIGNDINELLQQQSKLLKEKLSPFNFDEMHSSGLKNFKKLSAASKKELLKKYIKRITVYPGYLEIEYPFCIDEKFNNTVQLKY